MPEVNLLNHLIAFEESLLQNSTSISQPFLESILTEDFREFGSSGRIFTRKQIVDALSQESPQRISGHDYELRLVSPDAVLLTYRSLKTNANSEPITALRSSLWVHREGAWKLLFHQGTPVA